jgi:hypothetical protein
MKYFERPREIMYLMFSSILRVCVLVACRRSGLLVRFLYIEDSYTDKWIGRGGMIAWPSEPFKLTRSEFPVGALRPMLYTNIVEEVRILNMRVIQLNKIRARKDWTEVECCYCISSVTITAQMRVYTSWFAEVYSLGHYKLNQTSWL